MTARSAFCIRLRSRGHAPGRVASVPASDDLGAPRGSKHPDLESYEVAIRDRGGRTLGEGTPARQVSGELRSFERSLRQAVGALDKQIPSGQKPADENELLAVIELAAIAHGEWVRIHPYANGNGRVARIWANWVAIRYGLPPFIRIKPRPAGLLYQQAAHESMDRPPGHRGDHTTTKKLFNHQALSCHSPLQPRHLQSACPTTPISHTPESFPQRHVLRGNC